MAMTSDAVAMLIGGASIILGIIGFVICIWIMTKEKRFDDE